MDENNTISSSASRPQGASIFLWTLVGLILVAGFVYLVVKFNGNAEKRCLEEGGIWSAGRECLPAEAVEENAAIEPITLRIPDGGPEVSFPSVAFGSSSVSYAEQFSLGTSSNEGSVALEHDLGRVHPEARDLVMPYVVSYGGTGVFTYVGIFEKTSSGYAHRDSELVGDRVLLDDLALIPADGEGAYAVRLSYKDRGDRDALATAPTQTRVFEATVFNHQFELAFVLGEGALLYKDVLKVTDPALRERVSTPLTVEGFARGSWFFEGSFPLILADWDGRIIAEGSAEAQGDSMTNQFVPFKGTLTFNTPAQMPNPRATLILKKDNPSGLSRYDDAFEIPVTLQ